MVAFFNDPPAADHDIAHRIVVAGENQGIEQHLDRPPHERGTIGVEHYEVGPAAGREAPNGPAKRLGASQSGHR